MSDRYPGGLIRKTPPTITPPVDGEGGSAPGIWTLEQVAYYQGTGEWPKPVLPRELYGIGYNLAGTVGDKTQINRSSPVQVGPPNTPWASLGYVQSTGAFAVAQNGKLYSWGSSADGQLAQSALINYSSPTQVGALTTWAYVSQTEAPIGFGIKTDGTLWAWGNNTQGFLGLNTSGALDRRSSPVQVGALTTWQKVQSGTYPVFGLQTNGTIWSWGRDVQGSLGQNNANPAIYRSSPTQIGTDTDWSDIAAGYYFGLAVKTNGTLWSWGANSEGQLGLNSTIPRSSPTQVGALTNWLSVDAGFYSTLAKKTDGTLWAWGDGPRGVLGNNAAPDVSSPIQIGTLATWDKFAVGGWTAVATLTDGTVWSWGYNIYGQLGHNNIINTSSPVQIGSASNWSLVNVSSSGVFISE